MSEVSVHVNYGGGSIYLREQFDCPICKGPDARILVHESGSPWYSPDVTCVECGDSWCEGELSERPFRRGWRAKSQRDALARFEAAPPLGTKVVRDWTTSGGGYVDRLEYPAEVPT